jgi:hypothetical protein
VLRCLHLYQPPQKTAGTCTRSARIYWQTFIGRTHDLAHIDRADSKARAVLTNNPTLMSIYRMGKTRSHEQVAPVPLGEIHRATEVFHVSLTQLERSKT